MKINTVMGLLSLFGGEAEGGSNENGPVLTPQAQNTGDNSNAPVAGEQNESKRRDEEFRALMQGEYKEQFAAYFQETFNRRFKQQKEMSEELERSRQMLDEAALHFGVGRDELPEAIRREREKKSNERTASIENTPETVQENGAFSSRDEIDREIEQAVADAVVRARIETEQAMLADIRARGLRPVEGALSDVGGDALHGRANSLTRTQRAEVARRAARGERIKF